MIRWVVVVPLLLAQAPPSLAADAVAAVAASRAAAQSLAAGRVAQEAGRLSEADTLLRAAVGADGAVGDAACFFLGVNEAMQMRWTSAARWFRRAFAEGRTFGDELARLPDSLSTRVRALRDALLRLRLQLPPSRLAGGLVSPLTFAVVSASAAAAAVVAGLIVSRSASAAEDDIRVSQREGRLTNRRYQTLLAAMSSNRSIANGLFVLGGALSVFSLRFFFTHWRQRDTPREAPVVGLAVTPGQLALSVGARF